LGDHRRKPPPRAEQRWFISWTHDQQRAEIQQDQRSERSGGGGKGRGVENGWRTGGERVEEEEKHIKDLKKGGWLKKEGEGA